MIEIKSISLTVCKLHNIHVLSNSFRDDNFVCVLSRIRVNVGITTLAPCHVTSMEIIICEGSCDNSKVLQKLEQVLDCDIN